MAYQYVASNRYVINNDDVYPKHARNFRTFREAAQSYLDHGGQGRYMEALVDLIGDRPVSSITPFDIKEAALSILPDRKNATLNRCVLTPARSVINHAYERGWFNLIRIKRLKEEKPVRRGYATPVWLYLFFRQCRVDGLPHVAALVLFMAQTGARVSEALRLSWSNVNLHKREALLVRTKTDTNSIRALTDELVTRFTELQYLHSPAPDDPIFVITNRHNVNDRLKAICRRAGIEYKPAHTCSRVTYANMAMDLGVDVKTAMAGGGWVGEFADLPRYIC
jgi:integrase